MGKKGVEGPAAGNETGPDPKWDRAGWVRAGGARAEAGRTGQRTVEGRAVSAWAVPGRALPVQPGPGRAECGRPVDAWGSAAGRVAARTRGACGVMGPGGCTRWLGRLACYSVGARVTRQAQRTPARPTPTAPASDRADHAGPGRAGVEPDVPRVPPTRPRHADARARRGVSERRSSQRAARRGSDPRSRRSQRAG